MLTAKEQIAVNSIVDTINGEINRMCVTSDLEEFDTMYQHAKKNLENLAKIIYEAKFAAYRTM